jgi:Domain of unknown function (DUF1918)
MHSTEDLRKARVGDRIVVRGHHVGQPIRAGEVLEVVGEYGAPPYMVRWELDGHVSRLYPSSDAHIEHGGPRQSTTGESPGGG